MQKTPPAPERDILQIKTSEIFPDPKLLIKRATRAEKLRAAKKMKKCFGTPLKVTPAPACSKYILLSDEVRLRAALMLGYKYVPCEIFEGALKREKFAFSDARILVNSVERAVETSRRAGIDAQFEKTDKDGDISMTVTVHRAHG